MRTQQSTPTQGRISKILFYKVPVQLKQFIHFIDPINILCEAFCLSHQITLASFCNSIHILYLRRLDIIKTAITHNHLPSLFIFDICP